MKYPFDESSANDSQKSRWFIRKNIWPPFAVSFQTFGNKISKDPWRLPSIDRISISSTNFGNNLEFWESVGTAKVPRKQTNWIIRNNGGRNMIYRGNFWPSRPSFDFAGMYLVKRPSYWLSFFFLSLSARNPSPRYRERRRKNDRTRRIVLVRRVPRTRFEKHPRRKQHFRFSIRN